MSYRWFLCLPALMLAAPAAAQLSNGTSGYSSAPREGVEAEYWSLLDQLGPCLANQKPDQAAAFVGADIGSSAESAAFDVLFNVGRNRRNNCLGRFSGLYGAQRAHLRGSVAEGLFEKLPDETLNAFLANPPTAPETVATLHDFARCYVVAHPAAARDLLRRTDISSEGELQFIRQIAADFAPCLPEGRDVQLNPTSVRMAIAEAAWRAATGRPTPKMQASN